MCSQRTIYFYFILVLLTVVQNPVKSDNSQQPRVHTKYGTYVGFTEELPEGRSVNIFLGIPFAQPPVGELRFKPPLPLRPSNKTFEVTSQPNSCYQKYTPLSNIHPPLMPLRPMTELSEDCLYMNIWSPKGSNKLLPVMIYIYGGGFSRGSVATTAHDGKYLAATEKVVVLMFNYRLGSLGFLFLDHPEVPGNAGLFDQVLAFEWVKENIANFGGDPNSVTLFGQSAGAASVAYHLLSPKSWKYFHRAIIQSGTPMSFWAYNTRKIALDFSEKLISNLGCPKVNGTDAGLTLECLRKVDTSTLIFSEPQGQYDMVYTFRPVIDYDLLLGDQLKLFRTGKFKRIDILLGTNRDEGTVFLLSFDPILFQFNDNLNIQMHNVNELGRKLVGYGEIVTDIVQILYYDPTAPNVSETYTRYVNQGFSDYLFHCPTNQLADTFTTFGNKVYRYYFTHRSANSKWPKWVGTPHGEELAYVFGYPTDPRHNFKENEKQLSLRMMKYWANYARTGDPNVFPEGEEPVESMWPEYTLDQQNYLVLAPNSTQVGRRLRGKSCFFWDNFFDSLDNRDNTSRTVQRCCS